MGEKELAGQGTGEGHSGRRNDVHKGCGGLRLLGRGKERQTVRSKARAVKQVVLRAGGFMSLAKALAFSLQVWQGGKGFKQRKNVQISIRRDHGWEPGGTGLRRLQMVSSHGPKVVCQTYLRGTVCSE